MLYLSWEQIFFLSETIETKHPFKQPLIRVKKKYLFFSFYHKTDQSEAVAF